MVSGGRGWGSTVVAWSGAVAAGPGTDPLRFVVGLGDMGVVPVVVEDGIGGVELFGVGDGGGDEGAVVLLEDGAVLELEEGAEGGVFGLSEGVFVEEVVEVFEVVGGLACQLPRSLTQ